MCGKTFYSSPHCYLGLPIVRIYSSPLSLSLSLVSVMRSRFCLWWRETLATKIPTDINKFLRWVSRTHTRAHVFTHTSTRKLYNKRGTQTICLEFNLSLGGIRATCCVSDGPDCRKDEAVKRPYETRWFARRECAPYSHEMRQVPIRNETRDPRDSRACLRPHEYIYM